MMESSSFCRGESGEKFKKAVRAVQKKIKPTGRPSLKKAVRRSPSPENRCMSFLRFSDTLSRFLTIDKQIIGTRT